MQRLSLPKPWLKAWKLLKDRAMCASRAKAATAMAAAVAMSVVRAMRKATALTSPLATRRQSQAPPKPDLRYKRMVTLPLPKSSASAAPVTVMAATAGTVAHVARMVRANTPIRLKSTAPLKQQLQCKKPLPQSLQRLNRLRWLLPLLLLQPQWQLRP